MGTETTRACDAGAKGGSQLSYCETVLNSAFFVTVPFLRIKMYGVGSRMASFSCKELARTRYSPPEVAGPAEAPPRWRLSTCCASCPQPR